MTQQNTMPELKRCPFCGSRPNVESWHGGKPTKKMISCPGIYANSIMGICNGEEITCPVAPCVTGETMRESIENWNTRTPDHTDLLKQARSALIVSSVAMKRAGFMGYPEQCDEVITVIDKILGEIND